MVKIDHKTSSRERTSKLMKLNCYTNSTVGSFRSHGERSTQIVEVRPKLHTRNSHIFEHEPQHKVNKRNLHVCKDELRHKLLKETRGAPSLLPHGGSKESDLLLHRKARRKL
jgi:hypothetical protein